jgi:hypothetical protein
MTHKDTISDTSTEYGIFTGCTNSGTFLVVSQRLNRAFRPDEKKVLGEDHQRRWLP